MYRTRLSRPTVLWCVYPASPYGTPISARRDIEKCGVFLFKILTRGGNQRTLGVLISGLSSVRCGETGKSPDWPKLAEPWRPGRPRWPNGWPSPGTVGGREIGIGVRGTVRVTCVDVCTATTHGAPDLYSPSRVPIPGTEFSSLKSILYTRVSPIANISPRPARAGRRGAASRRRSPPGIHT